MTDDLFKEEHRSQAGEYLRALRRRWLLILALVVLAAWTAAAFIATADKKYEAEADILVTPFADSTGTYEGITLFRDPTSSIYAAGRIMTTPATTDAVIERLDLGVSREDLLDSGEDQAAGTERHRLDHRGSGITGGCSASLRTPSPRSSSSDGRGSSRAS